MDPHQFFLSFSLSHPTLCCHLISWKSISENMMPDTRFGETDTLLNPFVVEADTLGETGTVDTLLSPLVIPPSNYKYCNAKNGLVNGIVRRATLGNKDRFVFYLQTGETEERHSRTPILVAQRVVGSKFLIFDVSGTPDFGGVNLAHEDFDTKDDERYLGLIKRIRDPSKFIAFSLFQGRKENKTQVESILYRIPSTISWLKGQTFRECHVVMSSNNGRAGGRGVKEAVDSVLLRNPICSIVNPGMGIHVSTTLLPAVEKDEDGNKSYRTNFGGRCRQTASENMKLVDEDSGTPNLQMGCWNENEYSLDFAAPYNAFQAFAFALAQFEL